VRLLTPTVYAIVRRTLPRVAPRRAAGRGGIGYNAHMDPGNAPERAFTAAEATAMDAWLVETRGFTIPQLMAAAGARLADAARELAAARGCSRVSFLVGPGNNGGDALVAESALRSELATEIWRPLGGGAAPTLGAETLLVDGLFGVGLARPIEGGARAAVDRVNGSDAVVLAVDIPSGLCATTGEVMGGCALRADLTLTFVGPKRGFFLGAGPGLVGRWTSVEIGFPAEEAWGWLAARRGADG
jgi:NAD(P)H-hydrate epimerase